jgi:group I intron endonuclease
MECVSKTTSLETNQQEFCKIELKDYLIHPQMRIECRRGYGQVYIIEPKFSNSNSNGYVGQTDKSLLTRVRGHITPKSGCHGLANAIKKHGVANFTIRRLQHEIPKKNLDDAEVYWISKMDTWHNGYNCGPGGKTSTMVDTEVKARHHAAVVASHNTPEYLRAQSERSTALAKQMKKVDPDFHRNNALRQHKDPEKKAIHSSGVKKGWIKRKKRGFDHKHSASAKAMWTDEYRQRRKENETPETKARRKAGCKSGQAKLTPEQRSERVKRGWEKRRANKILKLQSKA